MADDSITLEIFARAEGSFFTSGSVISRLAIVSSYISLSFTPRWNARGVATVILREDDLNNQAMMLPDAYGLITYLGRPLYSGKIRTRSGDFDPSGVRTYTLRDDSSILDDLLAWVRTDRWLKPLSLTTEQTEGQWYRNLADPVSNLVRARGYYDWSSPVPAGEADLQGIPTDTETAVRKLLLANFYRNVNDAGQPGNYLPLGLSFDGPNLHRGLTLAPSDLPNVRMGKLSDYIYPLLDAAGLGLTVLRGVNNSVELRCTFIEAGEWQSPLTAESGTIVSPSTWSLSDPIVTRVVVGGPGELAMRAFDTRVNLETEQQINWVSEVFRDATNAGVVWPDSVAEDLQAATFFLLRPEVSAQAKAELTAYLLAAADETMLEGAATSSLSLTLSETRGLHFGGDDGIQLGDIVTAERGARGTPGFLSFTDQLREVTITDNRDGLKVTPKVGNVVDSPQRKIYEAIARLGTSQRRLSTGR